MPRSCVRVERRPRGHELYINDGAYGTLFDAAHIGWKYPVQLLREPESDARDMDFAFWGPTCDDLDYMAGPFPLPADTKPATYFEIGMLGAYGQAMRTGLTASAPATPSSCRRTDAVGLRRGPPRRGAACGQRRQAVTPLP